jgi:hypothetical protein
MRAPHTALQDDTQQAALILLPFLLVQPYLMPSLSRDKPVTVADVRRLNQQSGAL